MLVGVILAATESQGMRADDRRRRLRFVTALVCYGLAHTPFGRELAMLCANRRAALLVGLRPARLLAASFIVSGALAGPAGVFLVGRSGANPEAGPRSVVKGVALIAGVAPAAHLGRRRRAAGLVSRAPGG